MTSGRLPAPYPLPPAESRASGPVVSLGGLPLGTAGPGRPVCLDLPRASATTVAVLASHSVATLLAVRAVELGTRVVVCSREPGWELAAAIAGTERGPVEREPVEQVPVETADPEQAGSLAGSFQRPLLVVTPARSPADIPADPPRPWVTSLVALPRADLRSMPVLREAHVVLLGTVPPPQLALVRSTLRLPTAAVEGLSQQPWTSVLAVAGGRYTHVDLDPSPAERRRCAPPEETPADPAPAGGTSGGPFPAEDRRSFAELAGLEVRAAASPATRTPAS